MDLLRFTTAGSVDDGKSTLIGRLLYDSKGVYEDQLASARKSGGLDLSLLTDGLRAEREQGITIDVAYRYFSTPRRKFIIADTPGHEQYTRNMATGASNASLAVILIDARAGVLPQSRRHAFIASLLGIPHVVVAVNKMDLVDYSRDVFESIKAEFSAFLTRLHIPEAYFIPLSALRGDNVVTAGGHTPWFTGGSLLDYLETVTVTSDRNLVDVRFPVQHVLRPNLDFRGYAGQVASGVIRPGDPVMALPSGRTTRVRAIPTWDGDLEQAFPPMSVTLVLEDEIDLARGDMLVAPLNRPHVARRLEAHLVWMSERPLDPGRPYLVKHTTRQVRGAVREIRHRVNINTLAHEPAAELRLNEIGVVALETQQPLFFDPYRRNRATGSFILIDPISNETVAAGMISGRLSDASLEHVSAAERHARAGHKPVTLRLNIGEDLARELERKLFDRGCQVHVVTGDYSPRLAEICEAAGLITIWLDAAGEQARDADEICAGLSERGILGADPSMGGGGI